MSDKAAEGTFAPPPPDAPRQVTVPLEAGVLSDQLARARANERSLAPLAAPGVPIVPAPRPVPTEVVIPQTQNPMPAASNSDSPSRGIPREIADPRKRITGGFGEAEAQYYPLNGNELLVLVQRLMQQLDTRIVDDLRFHIGMCYPRVRVRVAVEVEGYADAGNFTIEKIAAHDKTPLEVARDRSDEIAFVVRELRQEFDAAGNIEDPPDRLRDDLGLLKPRKQMVQAGASKVMVDIPTLEGSF